MTAEQIHVMEAGPEMDRAVAEACGIRICSPHPGDVILYDNPDAGSPFAPSDDWNDAMFAAERFGLFNEAERSLQLWRVGWVVCRELPEGLRLRDRIVGCASTGPLAISRAILLTNLSRKSASSD